MSFWTHQWAAAKDAEVAEKVRTAFMMARKSRGDIELDCMCGPEVLGPAEYEGIGGTEGAEEAGSGTVTDGAAEAGIWGSSTGTVGSG